MPRWLPGVCDKDRRQRRSPSRSTVFPVCPPFSKRRISSNSPLSVPGVRSRFSFTDEVGWCSFAMDRPLRMEFAGVLCQVTARGGAWAKIPTDDRDCQRPRDDLGETIQRYRWEPFTFAFMPNPMHLFFRTSEANLSKGRQYLLSGHAPGLHGDTSHRNICS
jgi:hypothetical protein